MRLNARDARSDCQRSGRRGRQRLHVTYTNEQSPEAARRFLATLRHAFQQLLSMPEIGHVWETERRDLQGVRAWRIDDFPLSIFYFPHPNAIEVIRVLHHSRDIKAILDDI